MITVVIIITIIIIIVIVRQLEQHQIEIYNFPPSEDSEVPLVNL